MGTLILEQSGKAPLVRRCIADRTQLEDHYSFKGPPSRSPAQAVILMGQPAAEAIRSKY
jgi:hypothetical protein